MQISRTLLIKSKAMLDHLNKLTLPEPLGQSGDGFKDIFCHFKIHIPLYTRQSVQDISRKT